LYGMNAKMRFRPITTSIACKCLSIMRFITVVMLSTNALMNPLE